MPKKVSASDRLPASDRVKIDLAPLDDVGAELLDLAVLAMGAHMNAAQAAGTRGVRATRLGAIKVDAITHLRQQDLSVASIAARHGITPRYVQRLFEAEGTTFSQFVLAQRLLLAHRLLTDPRHATSKTITIASEASFADLSYFNRAFRRHYAASPSHVRQAALLRHRPQ